MRLGLAGGLGLFNHGHRLGLQFDGGLRPVFRLQGHAVLIDPPLGQPHQAREHRLQLGINHVGPLGRHEAPGAIQPVRDGALIDAQDLAARYQGGVIHVGMRQQRAAVPKGDIQWKQGPARLVVGDVVLNREVNLGVANPSVGHKRHEQPDHIKPPHRPVDGAQRGIESFVVLRLGAMHEQIDMRRLQRLVQMREFAAQNGRRIGLAGLCVLGASRPG